MERLKITTITVFFLLITVCYLLMSCNQTGEHIIINYNDKIQINSDKDNSTNVVNKDSINKEKQLLHEKLSLKEHRVYYLDYSGSMEKGQNKNIDGTGKTLFELTKEKLKKSIREIEGQNVTIEIIPFFDSWENEKPTICKITKEHSFTAEQLKKIDNFLDDITVDHNGSTHHSIAINDFLKNRINDKNQYHLMILLTDGEDYSNGDNIMDIVWPKYQHQYIYGVFVNLPETYEITGPLPERFKNTTDRKYHCYYKQGMNFNFKIFLLESSTTVNHRGDNIAYIAVGGRCAPTFSPVVQEDEFYRYTLLEQPNEQSDFVKIKVEPLTDSSFHLPNVHVGKLEYKYIWNKNGENANTEFIPDGDSIKITVIDEKTPNVKFWFANSKKDNLPCIAQKIKFCKKLYNVNPEWSDTLTIRVRYEKSEDAKHKEEFNNVRLKINNFSESVKLLSKDVIYLDRPSDTISVMLALDPSNENLKNDSIFESLVTLENPGSLNEIIVNDVPLNSVEASNNLGTIRIQAVKKMHPALVNLLWILGFLLFLFLLGLFIILHHRAHSLRFPIKGRAVFLYGGDGANIQIRGKKYKNKQIVPETKKVQGSDTIKTELLNEYYIKEIFVINKNKEKELGTKESGFLDKLWNGHTIYLQGVEQIFDQYKIKYMVFRPSGTRRNEDIHVSIVFDNDRTQIFTLPISTLSSTIPETKKILIKESQVRVCGERINNNE